MQTVTIDILGRPLNIRTDGDASQVVAAGELIESHAEEIRQGGGVVASDRLLALVALNLAGELLHGENKTPMDLTDTMNELDMVLSKAQNLAQTPLR